jgi:TonB-linked SusC/RagA family outer membrane protein
MKLKFHRITLLFFIFIIQISYSQITIISGTISDSYGPITGIEVVIKNTTNRTQTDFDGNFSIETTIGSTLTIKHIGMLPVERKIVSAAYLNITLQEDANKLDEVVIVAYGTQNKKSITGAMSVVSSETLDKQQITSIGTVLQGNVAGVHIINSGGQPGENPTIRIRGVSSINASADPLIILDGAPFNGNLNAISADQIESINVLKDASSTSLYGSRGSNGVILITSKQGKYNSPTKVTFNTKYGFASAAVDRHELIDTDTFTQYTWEALRNSNLYDQGQTSNVAATNASNELINHLGYNPYGIEFPVGTNGKLTSTSKLWDTNWANETEKNAAKRTEHSIGVSGGNENTTYYFSTNYLNHEGTIKTANFERVTSRITIDTKVNKWFKTGLTAFYSTSSQNRPVQSGGSNNSTGLWTNNMPSLYPLYQRDANGILIKDTKGNQIYDYGNNSSQSVNGTRPLYQDENIVGSLYNNQILNKQDNFTANGYIQLQLAKNLVFKTQVSYEKYTFDSYSYEHYKYGAAANVDGRITQDRNFTTTKNSINSLNYKKTYGDNSFNIDVIQEAFEKNIDNLAAQGTGFLPSVKVLDGAKIPVETSGSITNETLLSYLGRVAYNYKEKYFLESSFRTDGSSRFHQDVRWGSFFSIGGAWVLSDEKFIQNIYQIQFLKLRASYGELGNNRTLDKYGDNSYFPYLSLFEAGWNELSNGGVVLGDAADPLLTWEKTASSDIGVDFGLFGNLFSGSVDYYSKESVDLIYDKPLAPSTGNTTVKTNIGSIKNYGVEVLLNANIINNQKVKWTSSLNLSFDRNEITELSQDSFINGTKKWEVGKSLYDFYTKEWAGVDPATGYGLWYVDVKDSEGIITGRDVTNDYDKASRNYADKSSLPDMIGGFNNFVSYGAFDLNILFNFSKGAYVYDYSYAALMEGMKTVKAGSVDLINRWQQPGDITNVPLLLNTQNNFTSPSDRFLFKNEYLRLKALTIGYNVSQGITNKINLSKLRLYFKGDNLATWQSHKGIDPEQSLSGTTNYRSFNQKICSFGLQLEF